MSSNRLKLNADKTDFIWLGTRQQLAKVNRDCIVLDGVNIKPSREVTLLGVVIDEKLKFTSHIKDWLDDVTTSYDSYRRCVALFRKKHRSCLSTLSSSAALTIAIASATMWQQSIFTHFSQSSTPPHDWLSKGSTTTSPLKSVIRYSKTVLY